MTEERKKMSKGCMVALIVVGSLAVLAIILSVVCYVYKDELIQAGLSKMTEAVGDQIKTALPEGYTAEDVDSIMEEFRTAITEGKIDKEEMQDFSNKFQQYYNKEGITPEQSKEMLEMIRKAIDE